MQYGRLDPTVEAALAEQELDSLRVGTVDTDAVVRVVRTMVSPGRHMASRRGRIRAAFDYDGPEQHPQD